jgi:hypothetical protein
MKCRRKCRILRAVSERATVQVVELHPSRLSGPNDRQRLLTGIPCWRNLPLIVFRFNVALPLVAVNGQLFGTTSPSSAFSELDLYYTGNYADWSNEELSIDAISNF